MWSWALARLLGVLVLGAGRWAGAGRARSAQVGVRGRAGEGAGGRWGAQAAGARRRWGAQALGRAGRSWPAGGGRAGRAAGVRWARGACVAGTGSVRGSGRQDARLGARSGQGKAGWQHGRAACAHGLGKLGARAPGLVFSLVFFRLGIFFRVIK